MDTAEDWGVYVNEVSINATRQGIEWWTAFSARFEGTGRMTCLTPSIAGSAWHVACDNELDAGWLAWEMVEEHGIPKRAVKVKRLSQCQHLTGKS
jgi:hypothetical protein